MNRREAVLLLLALGAPGSTRSQAETKIRRVGVLATRSSNSSASVIDALKAGLRDLGWREGQNVEYRLVYAEGRVERLDALAKQLVEQKVEVIVLGTPQAARAAQKATSTIPVVMAYVSNAVENKFVASLARPGGNITGVTSQLEVVLGKLIEIFHQAAPHATRIAILLNESNPSHHVFWRGAQKACAALNLVPMRVVASAPDQLPGAVSQLVRERAQAIVVVADAMYVNERAKLEELIRATRLPAAYAIREHVVEGGLLSYSADVRESFRYAATFVDKILKGAKPADLPVEQPTKFELVINLRTARALGLTIPSLLLLRADQMIE
jgi:putative ABC transport system substrate-binding protein